MLVLRIRHRRLALPRKIQKSFRQSAHESQFEIRCFLVLPQFGRQTCLAGKMGTRKPSQQRQLGVGWRLIADYRDKSAHDPLRHRRYSSPVSSAKKPLRLGCTLTPHSPKTNIQPHPMEVSSE
jgi:hypothetical protein